MTKAFALGKHADFQVVVSTHSAYFVSRNTADLTALCRLQQPDHIAEVGQISAADLGNMVLSNQKMNTIAAKYPKYKPGPDDVAPDMECVKNFMWLNAERTGLFFARRVLLVEGPTEIAAVNHPPLEMSVKRSLRGSPFPIMLMGSSTYIGT